ncbi:MAG: phosphatase PAP2 family protein [Bacteroidales bacterium]|nr:phosphatase PAP2 family protein [Bacteroidales bacterium]MDD3891685.1 phosphatase PAP2 family protein [Bacteroidales bacterium]
MLDWLIHLDTQIFLLLNGLNSPFFDPIMIFFSGKLTWLPLYLLIIFYMYKRFGWRLVWPLMGILLVVVLADQTSVRLFKNVFERLRPCHNPDIMDMVHLVANHCGGKFGFISSHAANTFGIAIFLTLLFKKRWFTLWIIVWATVVSYSRIYLGVHYPGDVLVGGLVGSLCGYAVWRLYRWLNTTYGLEPKQNQ